VRSPCLQFDFGLFIIARVDDILGAHVSTPSLNGTRGHAAGKISTRFVDIRGGSGDKLVRDVPRPVPPRLLRSSTFRLRVILFLRVIGGEQNVCCVNGDYSVTSVMLYLAQHMNV